MIPLSSVSIDNIVISNKTKNNSEIAKYCIGYFNDIESVTPLCIILPERVNI